jgi:hypothetical protein
MMVTIAIENFFMGVSPVVKSRTHTPKTETVQHFVDGSVATVSSVLKLGLDSRVSST